MVAGCMVCGEKDPSCLVYHHLGPDCKDACVSDAISNGRGPMAIEAEMAKCVVLCSNCHRKYHAGSDAEVIRAVDNHRSHGLMA